MNLRLSVEMISFLVIIFLKDGSLILKMNKCKMDLKDKLRQFESNFQAPELHIGERKCADVDQFVRGEEVTNTCGSYFRSVTVFPEDHRHGEISLNLIWESDPAVFCLVGKDESFSHVDLRKVLFIDTETTGLAGGVGTLPFMVGMGYFTDEGFQVEQLLMRDYDEEQAVLWAVRDRLEHCDMLVSYNGKCYDMNILSSRFTLARMENPAVDLPHLDLLFPVRRLWRRRISDCSLSNVERAILGFFRESDIPSYLIPGLYFDYLRSRDGRLL
ncbi:ribonuclease H-like domain-containing protein, partial [bacterium]|nr:ribonuclease H-like domain-containing protein [bacterium]